MANVTRIRVELKKKYNDPKKNFNDMFQEFKRRYNNSGIAADYKDHESYESKSQKRRKKRIESKKRRQMETLEQKVLGGEKVKASAGMMKKVLSNINKDKKDNKKRNNYRNDD